MISALVARRRRLAEGRDRDDGRRLGLVVEGGAMRAIVCGGCLVALADLGFDGVFDRAYASSAGAISLAYFLSGDAYRGIPVYRDHAAKLRFLNPLRVGRIVDIDYLVREVIQRRHPFDAERLVGGPTELFVSVTDARSGRNRMVSVREPGVDVHDLLTATAAVPIYSGRRVDLPGGRYVDGVASDSLPVERALQDGCTHVLVILSTRPGEGSTRPARRGRHDVAWPERLLLRSEAPGFRRAYLTRRRRARRSLALALEDPRVFVIHPTAACPVPSRTCRSRRALAAAFDAARARVNLALGPQVAG